MTNTHRTLSVKNDVYAELRRLSLAEDRPISTIIARALVAYIEPASR